MSESNTEGRIELILGPMFSGKSTRLIEVIRKYTYKAKKTIMVKFYADKRYSEKSEVVTHDLIKYDSIDCKKLRDSIDLLQKYDVIGIDEGQFFPDLVEACEELALAKKIIIIAAINGDFRMEPFPVISKIIAKADKIKLLKAYCFNCHKDAKFSLRIVQSNETVLIGAGEAYKPACRECHKFFSMEREKGNLNIDKIIKNLDEKRLKKIIEAISSSIVEIGTNNHGTRVIQFLISCLTTRDLQDYFVEIIKPHTIQLLKELNGAHIIQKVLLEFPDSCDDINKIIIDNCSYLAAHRHGCCVLQKFLDGNYKKLEGNIKEVLEYIYLLKSIKRNIQSEMREKQNRPINMDYSYCTTDEQRKELEKKEEEEREKKNRRVNKR